MRAKVYYGKEIHIVDLEKVVTLDDLIWIVRSSFAARLPSQIGFVTAHGDDLDESTLRNMNRKGQSLTNLFIISRENSILKSVKSEQSFECLENNSAEEYPRMDMKEKFVDNMDKESEFAKQ